MPDAEVVDENETTKENGGDNWEDSSEGESEKVTVQISNVTRNGGGSRHSTRNRNVRFKLSPTPSELAENDDQETESEEEEEVAIGRRATETGTGAGSSRMKAKRRTLFSTNKRSS